ncbi:MAG TPA: sulfatase [Thermoanaerobaculia bacterium]|nr:sulfatase [Thermoanaerobaculia bacterium]
MRIVPSPLLLCALLLALAGCGGRGLPEDLFLQEAVGVKQFAVGAGGGPGLRFVRAPELLDLTYDGQRRATVLTSVDPWRWTGRIPPGAELHAGVQILPEGWGVIQSFRAWVVARSGREREVLDVVQTANRRHPYWLDLTADLSRWAGEEVTLEFSASVDGLPPEHRHSNVVAWGPVRISSAPAERDRPNILLIVVDTLRFDHLTPYGYRRDTSPHIERLLAQSGTVVEEAYAQAPWTLPSVISFLTSRSPGEILGDDSKAYGLPPGVETLAGVMADLGYETGGFFANRTLHEGNGFARGFKTFFSPPKSNTSVTFPDGGDLNARVLPWLEAHRNAPFFLYVHYMDPHDPYVNPEIAGGRSPYFPEYKGKLDGTDVHGINMGQIALENPKEDVAQITALYDSEIRYVDRFIGELIDSLPPRVLANTLIVLTADHGEELYDHGGWKHGFSLYEDQIHVPFLARWDGRIPAGRRISGTVRLLDLAPTLVKAAGGKVPPSWQGIDLMPALTGAADLPRRPAFAQHMMTGPLRAAAVLDRRKLILFNDQTPFAPANRYDERFWTLDLGRMQRVELYDLAKDPRERSNQVAARPGEVERLQPVIHRQLDRQLPGLRVFASGLALGTRLRGSLTLDRPPTEWLPYFLGADDRVELAGARVSFDLGGEALEKGFLLLGDVGRVQRAEADLDGAPARVLLGAGSPPPSGGPALKIWTPGQERKNAPAQPRDPETEKRLRALGYIQ